MDPTIVAAIIGAIGALAAAATGLIARKHNDTRKKARLEQARAIRLGYILSELKSYFDARNHGFDSELMTAVIARQTPRAYEIARSLGIVVNPDATELLTAVPLKLAAKPTATNAAFEVGRIIGHIYFYAINLIATGTLKLNKVAELDVDIESEIESLLRTAEERLRLANLPPRYPEPIRELWKNVLASAQRGNFRSLHSINEEMQQALDNLCASIEDTK